MAPEERPLLEILQQALPALEWREAADSWPAGSIYEATDAHGDTVRVVRYRRQDTPCYYYRGGTAYARRVAEGIFLLRDLHHLPDRWTGYLVAPEVCPECRFSGQHSSYCSLRPGGGQ